MGCQEKAVEAVTALIIRKRINNTKDLCRCPTSRLEAVQIFKLPQQLAYLQTTYLNEPCTSPEFHNIIVVPPTIPATLGEPHHHWPSCPESTIFTMLQDLDKQSAFPPQSRSLNLLLPETHF